MSVPLWWMLMLRVKASIEHILHRVPPWSRWCHNAVFWTCATAKESAEGSDSKVPARFDRHNYKQFSEVRVYFKKAHVWLLIKKRNLGKKVLENNRPASNSPVVNSQIDFQSCTSRGTRSWRVSLGTYFSWSVNNIPEITYGNKCSWKTGTTL